MRFIYIVIICVSVFMLSSCGGNKTIFKGNKIYKYVNNQGKGKNDQIIEYKVIEKIKTPIKDKSNSYELSNVEESKIEAVDSAYISPAEVKRYLGLENIFYTHENNTFMEGKEFENRTLKFYYGKFALSAMTIPLKYRGSIGNDSINPPTFETGFNINFAPAYRLNWSFHNPSKKLFGNEQTNYSITLGGLLGSGATDLKTKTNAPGLLSDRKSAVLSYGGIVLFGFNSIGIGYSIGWDTVLGEGGNYWVYQNKAWHGITISVDVIK